MFDVILTTGFKKSFKLMMKRGYDKETFKNIVNKLILGLPLDPNNKVHLLKGNFVGHFECHIKPDWLLIYYYDFENHTLVLVDTGTHSDLFKK